MVVPLGATSVTVAVTVVFPADAAVTAGAPGATTVHWAYKVVSPNNVAKAWFA